MEIFAWILFSFVILHFIYDGIVAPSIRLSLRYKLFHLRDELREERIINQGLDSEVFRYLEDSINTTIKVLAKIDYGLLKNSKHIIDNDSELKRRIEKRKMLISGCRSVRAKKIHEKMLELALCSFIVNSGGWFFYIIPIALPLLFFSILMAYVKNVIFIPSNEVDKIIPDYGKFATAV